MFGACYHRLIAVWFFVIPQTPVMQQAACSIPLTPPCCWLIVYCIKRFYFCRTTPMTMLSVDKISLKNPSNAQHYSSMGDFLHQNATTTAHHLPQHTVAELNCKTWLQHKCCGTSPASMLHGMVGSNWWWRNGVTVSGKLDWSKGVGKHVGSILHEREFLWQRCRSWTRLRSWLWSWAWTKPRELTQ